MHPYMYIYIFIYIHIYLYREDLALEEVPERAEMMEAMRKEFPNINITAK
jgi:hypothetical protein